jgi:hypothetical protein
MPASDDPGRQRLALVSERAPHAEWNDDQLRELRQVKGSDFEAVDVSSLMGEPGSGQARER